MLGSLNPLNTSVQFSMSTGAPVQNNPAALHEPAPTEPSAEHIRMVELQGKLEQERAAADLARENDPLRRRARDWIRSRGNHQATTDVVIDVMSLQALVAAMQETITAMELRMRDLERHALSHRTENRDYV